jgi:hypothetical protein
VIRAITGKPGGGKTWLGMRGLCDALVRGIPVATNINMVEGWELALARRSPVARAAGRKAVERRRQKIVRNVFVAADIKEIMRVKLAGEGESRGLVVLDEAAQWLNARTWSDDDREVITEWFRIHRHLGWDIHLVTQELDFIDKQVRELVEEEVRVRNIKRAKLAGIPLSPVAAFVGVNSWAGGSKTKRHVNKRELFFLDSRRALYKTLGRADHWDGMHDFGPPILLPSVRREDEADAIVAETAEGPGLTTPTPLELDPLNPGRAPHPAA